jgi:hypothetical protein
LDLPTLDRRPALSSPVLLHDWVYIATWIEEPVHHQRGFLD